MDNFRNLLQDTCFVFGSNLGGRHGKGAAEFARLFYGARPGQGEGIMGQSYGIPTKDARLKVLSLPQVRQHVAKFKEYAYSQEGREQLFQVTRIGCGLAGYEDKDIAPFFADPPSHVFLPVKWLGLLGHLPTPRLLVDGTNLERTTFMRRLSDEDKHKIPERVRTVLDKSTQRWGSSFEVVTTHEGLVSEVAREWARGKGLPWTPCPIDMKTFGKTSVAEAALDQQLAWYNSHALFFLAPDDVSVQRRISMLRNEGCVVKNVSIVEMAPTLSKEGPAP